MAHSANLDGVRALAVLAVLAYHFDLGGVSAGFFGVDIFFVLSGYLITSLLAAELTETGRVDLVAFIRRRLRRLLPASFAVVAVVAAVVFVAGTETSLTNQVAGAFAWTYNWVGIAEGSSYFAAMSAPSPLQHFWSLAIEEQFYLLWPVVALVFGPLALANRRRAIGLLVLAAGLSGWWMHHLVDGSGVTRVYFGTDTRVGALLIGAAAALAVPLGTKATTVSSRWAAGLAATGGAVFLAWLIFTQSSGDQWLYSGGFTMAAVAAAALIAGTSALGDLQPLVNRPMRWVGSRSYGLYLWHWPVIVFAPAAALGMPSTLITPIHVAISFGAAAVSYHLIEDPARRRWVPTLRHGVVLLAGAALVVAAVAVAPSTLDEESSAAVLAAYEPGSEIGVVGSDTITAPQPPRRNIALATTTTAPAPSTSTSTTVEPEPVAPWEVLAPPVRPEGPGREVRVMLIGDSVPFALGFMLDGTITASAAAPDSLVVATEARPGCSVSRLDHLAGETRAQYPECAPMPQHWRERTNQLDPDVALLVFGAWDMVDSITPEGELLVVGSTRWEEHMNARFTEMYESVTARGAVLAVTEVPCFVDSRSAPDVAAQRGDPARAEVLNQFIYEFAEARHNVVMLPFADVVCPGGSPALLADGSPFRDDGVHFAGAGIHAVWSIIGPMAAAVAR